MGLPASSRSAVEYFIGTQMCCCLYNCSWLLSLALLELHEFSLYSRPSVELHLYSQSSSQFNTATSACVCKLYALQLSSMLVFNARPPFNKTTSYAYVNALSDLLVFSSKSIDYRLFWGFFFLSVLHCHLLFKISGSSGCRDRVFLGEKGHYCSKILLL